MEKYLVIDGFNTVLSDDVEGFEIDVDTIHVNKSIVFNEQLFKFLHKLDEQELSSEQLNKKLSTQAHMFWGDLLDGMQKAKPEQEKLLLQHKHAMALIMQDCVPAYITSLISSMKKETSDDVHYKIVFRYRFNNPALSLEYTTKTVELFCAFENNECSVIYDSKVKSKISASLNANRAEKNFNKVLANVTLTAPWSSSRHGVDVGISSVNSNGLVLCNPLYMNYEVELQGWSQRAPMEKSYGKVHFPKTLKWFFAGLYIPEIYPSSSRIKVSGSLAVSTSMADMTNVSMKSMKYTKGEWKRTAEKAGIASLKQDNSALVDYLDGKIKNSILAQYIKHFCVDVNSGIYAMTSLDEKNQKVYLIVDKSEDPILGIVNLRGSQPIIIWLKDPYKLEKFASAGLGALRVMDKLL